jgi:hypothetical protein
MKPHLIHVKERDGLEAFYDGIRNSVAGCKNKWKFMKKEIKMAYLTKAKEQNAQNEKTGDQAKKNKVCVSLI